jgi:Gas vesicle synthesis protein GvpL/GvpF
MKLYVYCLAEDVDVLEQSTLGISGAPVRVLKSENFSVLVSDLNEDSVPVTRENALAHAAVVRSILDYATPLPFRFGTIVTEQQLRSYLSTYKPALENKLAAVRGCVEMSVKIIWENFAEKQPEPHDKVQATGTSFLAEKRRQIAGDEQRAAEASEISTWLHENLSGLIRDEQVTIRPTERLVLVAAHLIRRDKITQYREEVAGTCRNRPELHFLLSGPWPPYSFANIGLEFKTQFGVI